MADNVMTDDRRQAVLELIKWYWDTVDKGQHIINKSDFEFLYDMWEHGLSIYSTDIQTRLNIIREIYINHHPDKDKSFKI